MLKETLWTITCNSKEWERIMWSNFDWDTAIQEMSSVEYVDRNTEGGRRFYLLQPWKYSINLDYTQKHGDDEIELRIVDEQGHIMNDTIETDETIKVYPEVKATSYGTYNIDLEAKIDKL